MDIIEKSANNSINAPELYEWTYGDPSKKATTDVATIYSDNAKDYENLLDDIGWKSSAIGARVMQQELEKRNIPKDANIIDLGAGSGLVGLELNKFGYTNLSALDISTGMLDEAKKKNAYTEFILANINKDEKLESKNVPFDHCIAIGLFFTSQAVSSSFENMLKLIKKNGLIVFCIRKDLWYDEKSGYKEKADEMEFKGIWKQVGCEIERSYSIKKEDILSFYFTYQIQ